MKDLSGVHRKIGRLNRAGCIVGIQLQAELGFFFESLRLRMVVRDV